MPIYLFTCKECGVLGQERIVLGDIGFTPTCLKCGGKTVKDQTPQRMGYRRDRTVNDG